MGSLARRGLGRGGTLELVRLHLAPALLRCALARALPAEQVERAFALLVPEGVVVTEPRPIVELLERPCERLGADGERIVAELVRTTLADAVAHLEALLGPERGAWTWGRLHRVELAHPASRLDGARRPADLRAAPLERGGSVDTISNTAYRAPDFLQTDGTSWRMVLDVGAWDRSVAVNFPGQSGNLGDVRTQLDHRTVWGADNAVPLLFSRAAVEQATTQRIVLRPAPAGADADAA